MSKKIKLVISGSGTRFPMFVGAIKRLHEEGYEITHVCGTSGGAIIAACVACGMSTEDMYNFCLDILGDFSKLADPSLWSLIWNWGLIRGRKIENEFNKVFYKAFSQTKVPLKILTVNYDTSSVDEPYNVFCTKLTPDMNIAKAVRASMSSPLVFEPVTINNHRHIDGGIVANFPIDIYGKEGSDVVGLHIAPLNNKVLTRKKTKGLLGLAQYIVDITDIFISAATKEYIEDVNGATIIPLRTDFPSMSMELSQENIKIMFDQGYNSAHQYLSP